MGPLVGVRIIEFAAAGPAPFCAMMLADMGASIITIDRPLSVTPLVAPHYDVLRRNRSAIAVDLKTSQGLSCVNRLIQRADMLIEGFRPGAMERLGLGPDAARAANPRLVYGRVNGWGQDGALARMPGHDINFLALSGALDSIRRAGYPPSTPLNMLGDFAAGGMLLTVGLLAALHHARTSGSGQIVEAAMVDGLALLMASLFSARAGGPAHATSEAVLSGKAPWYDVYETKDCKYFAVGCLEPQFFANLLKVLELDAAWLPHQHALEHWHMLRTELETKFKGRTRDEWTTAFDGVEACATPVLTLDEALNHPHLRARHVFTSAGRHAQGSPAPRFSGTPAQPPREGRAFGDALREWNINEDDLALMCAASTPMTSRVD
ncbi:CaiB/BaiF CoA-transferase family protein [Bradyrhizobium sp. 33ap4]|uniref:CaiB/BaiF CoA transferase family protein n=1 Tax=Bradyrhizobium sp. 33ap4 TaxID=3061630 RepID=UPI00292FD6D3|nr:CaiB/BaiF CoA-transferase family protein [Bradyrhizobium sp. 33ap4]